MWVSYISCCFEKQGVQSEFDMSLPHTKEESDMTSRFKDFFFDYLLNDQDRNDTDEPIDMSSKTTGEKVGKMFYFT